MLVFRVLSISWILYSFCAFGYSVFCWSFLETEQAALYFGILSIIGILTAIFLWLVSMSYDKKKA